MNPLAQAALDRARHRPSSPSMVSKQEGSVRIDVLPMSVATGPINQFMRKQAQQEARDLVALFSAELDHKDGLILVTNALKRAANGRPGSHVQGLIDVIRWLELHTNQKEVVHREHYA